MYCDTNAELYYEAGTGNTSNGPPMKRQVLERFREKARQKFTPDPRRDMFFASVIWIKIDLSKKKSSASTPDGDTSAGKGGNGVAVTAVDFVTEVLKLNFDFVQLSAMNEELTRLGDFTKQTQVRQWHPSCIDRERVAPPVVRVSNAALMPIAFDDASLLAFPLEKQRRSKRWFREMWQFATWCILVNKRKGNPSMMRFSMQKSASSTLDEETRSHKYIDLYSRNLSGDALRMIMHGKKLLFAPKSPLKPPGPQQEASPPPSIPSFEPLAREEQWELSDMILNLPVAEQRKYRLIAEATLRSFKAGENSAPPSPTKLSAEALHSSMSTAAVPVSLGAVPLSPLTSSSSSPSKTSTRLPDLTADYAANHHHVTRSSTESVLQPKQHPLTPTASLKLSQFHSTSTDMLFGKKAESDLSPSKKLQSTMSASKHLWIQQAFIPASILKKAVPFINWNLGPISLCIFRDNSSRSSPESPTKNGFSESTESPFALPEFIPGESTDSPRCEFLKIGFERCSGSILICSSPTPSFLIEIRLGLFHATLFSPAHQKAINRTTRNNSISSDYIKDPEDGFLYVGLKYNCKDEQVSSLLPDAKQQQQHWDLKGKICVGPIKIDYNELTLQTSLATTTADVPPPSTFILISFQFSHH